jgi:hypothetical protein
MAFFNPFAGRFRIQSVGGLSAEQVARAIRDRLDEEEPSRLSQTGGHIEFGIPFLRWRRDALTNIDAGTIDVREQGGWIEVSYQLSMRRSLLVVAIFVSGIFGAILIRGAHVDPFRALAILAGMLLWLGGGNVVIAVQRFSRMIRATVGALARRVGGPGAVGRIEGASLPRLVPVVLVLFGGMAAALIRLSFPIAPIRCTYRVPEPPRPRAVYFAAVGAPRTVTADKLITLCRNELHVEATRLPALAADALVDDPDRHQVAAEDVMTLAQHDYSDILADPDAMVIVVTERDMYIRAFTWRFAFSYRRGDQITVLSTARLDPVFLGGRPNGVLLWTRTTKVLLRSLAASYYRMRWNDDPTSLLHRAVPSIDALDHLPCGFNRFDLEAMERGRLKDEGG